MLRVGGLDVFRDDGFVVGFLATHRLAVSSVGAWKWWPDYRIEKGINFVS